MTLEKRLVENLGGLCEVRTMKNDLIFVGKLKEALGLTILIVESNGGYVPPAVYHMEVKVSIRGPGQSLLVVGGRVGRSGDHFWSIESLKHFQSAEKRNYFRQKVAGSAEVTRIKLDGLPDADARRVDSETDTSEEDASVSARLIDISLGGILFGGKVRFVAGELVQLSNVRLMQEEIPFSFLCRVLRVDTYSNAPETLCGCRFEDQTDLEQDRLCRVIFALQRRELRKRRDL